MNDLNNSPLALMAIFGLLSLVLAGFGAKALVSGKSYDKWGNELTGGMAKFQGIALCVGAVMAFGMSIGQLARIRVPFGAFGGRGSGSALRPMDMPPAAQRDEESFIDAHRRLAQMDDEKFNNARTNGKTATQLFEERADKMLKSKIYGSTQGSSTSIMAASLVGFAVATDESDRICGLTPITQNRGNRRSGTTMGNLTNKHYLLLAPDDMVVSNVHLCVGQRVEAIQLEYAPYTETGLATSGRETSDWVGASDLKVEKVSRNGNLFTGVGGYDDASGISLQFFMLDPNKVTDELKNLTEAENTIALEDISQKRQTELNNQSRRQARNNRGFYPNRNPGLDADDSVDFFGDDDAEANGAFNDAMRQAQEQMAAARNRSRGGRNPSFSSGASSDNLFGSDTNDSASSSNAEAIEYPAGEAQDLGKVSIPLPPLKYALKNVQNSELVGFTLKGNGFIARGDAGSVLVGLRVGASKDGARNQILNLQPIYQIEDRYYYGERIGPAGGESQLLLAKPGYVVGGANVAARLNVESLQLAFLKFDPQTGDLDEKAYYLSETAGASSAEEERIYANGWQAIGLFGKQSADGIMAVGLAAVKASRDRSRNSNAEMEMRTWRSKNGQFSIEARFANRKGDKIVLVKEDGKSIEVDPAMLSEEDGDWLKDHQ